MNPPVESNAAEKSAQPPPPGADKPDKPTVCDLFCGAGGFSDGLRLAGFHIVCACDVDPIAGETYLLNHPGTIVIRIGQKQSPSSDAPRETMQ